MSYSSFQADVHDVETHICVFPLLSMLLINVFNAQDANMSLYIECTLT